MKTFINVIISDGNRTVNWDFPATMKLRDVLTRWKFSWVHGSVRLNGLPPIGEANLDTQVGELVEALMHRPATSMDVLRVSLKSAEVKKKTEVKEKENKEDVC